MTETAILLPDPSARLERAFRTVHDERMRGLAFVNPAIRVEALAFEPWKACWLGVMLTPWSMNLMLTPRDVAAWRPLPMGAKRRYTFPAGAFDFISAHDETIGDHLTCSLFSPVLEFADHETARETARLARDALFDPALAEPSDADAESPGSMTDGDEPAMRYGAFAGLEARLAAPISRRALMHGQIKDGDDEPRR